MIKPRPVFSIDRRCSAAVRRLAAFIEQRTEEAKAEIAEGFRLLREQHSAEIIREMKALAENLHLLSEQNAAAQSKAQK